MRTLVIANPAAGRGNGRGAAEVAARVMTVGGWDVSVRTTTGPGDASRQAQKAVVEGFDAVFACGGDGTLSQVVTGLLDSGIPAGLIPAGTGNDFARTVGLSRNPAEAAGQALGGRPRAVDLLEANGGAAWSLNVMGVGFDAAVAARMSRRWRLTGGAFAYVTAVVQELTVHRTTEVAIAVDGECWSGPALLVAIANAQSYAGGMRIAPLAAIDDSLLDVVLVEAVGRLEFLRSFPRVFRGTHLTHPAVRTWRGREVRLSTSKPCPVLVDGDLAGETPLTVRVSPRRGLLWLP